MDYKNDDVLREECEFGRRMGFLGKQAVHPRQLDIIQRCFLPTDQGTLERERGERVVIFIVE